MELLFPLISVNEIRTENLLVASSSIIAVTANFFDMNYLHWLYSLEILYRIGNRKESSKYALNRRFLRIFLANEFSLY